MFQNVYDNVTAQRGVSNTQICDGTGLKTKCESLEMPLVIINLGYSLWE